MGCQVRREAPRRGVQLGHVRYSRDGLEHKQAVAEVEGVCQGGLEGACWAEVAVPPECLRPERLGAVLCILSKPSLPRPRSQLAIEGYRMLVRIECRAIIPPWFVCLLWSPIEGIYSNSSYWVAELHVAMIGFVNMFLGTGRTTSLHQSGHSL